MKKKIKHLKAKALKKSEVLNTKGGQACIITYGYGEGGALEQKTDCK